MSEADIWNTLSAVDVNSRVEKKGNLSYLSWAWAWGMLMKHYPDANYVFEAPEMMNDGSVMITCNLTVGGFTRSMWLPVMDNRNNAVMNPDARKISDTKMRCLVKAMAMFGLGHYIYAGEDLPDPESIEIGYKKKNEGLKDDFFEEIKLIKDGIANDDLAAAGEAWFTLSNEMKEKLWVAPSKGGVFTTQEREIIKSTSFRVAYYGEDKKED